MVHSQSTSLVLSDLGFSVTDEPLEIILTKAGLSPICGVDEAGRGPLAGPVVAAAVIFRDCEAVWSARDSKTLTKRRRETCYRAITESLQYAVGVCSHEEIDELNILQASLAAMTRAIAGLDNVPKMILVDGIHAPKACGLVKPIRKGDALVATIGAASIVAKVHRDRIMEEFDRVYPGYGFARHMGYPTEQHRTALKRLGPCPIHRRTFKGVRELLQTAADAQ
ncbi:ribonuclease HII [bacterium]|nr:ribonuclease HII [bacterium]MBU1984913.1 ribonuclease HII [bacterium]